MTENKQPIRVLLVDDDEDDYFIIKRLFEKMPKSTFCLDWVDSIDTATQSIATDNHDVYLIDYRLGAGTGLELLSGFHLPAKKQPFIILTGAGDKQIETKAMKMGVADYLVKGKFDTDLLARVIHYSLQRKQMEQQRVQELIEINESKDEFISLASHQLRTPATAVKQYVGMILQGFAGDIPPQQEAFLKHAYSSNDRQLRIIDDIMRVAHLDMNRITLANEEFDLRDTIQSAIDDVKPEIEDKKQTIHVEIPSDPLPILADDSYLGMAVSNLIDNASKYTDIDKPIYVAVTKQDGQYVITVRDEGVGIKESDMKKLFIKFSRISNPLSIAANGTGLGLYWAKEIVELHSGTIVAESKIEKGTTFTITLPIEHTSAS